MNKDINTLIVQKLQKNMLEILRSDLIKYTHVCSTTPEFTLNEAIKRMTSCDFNLSELLGCQNLFYNHKALAKKLFGPTRFSGVPIMHHEEHKFMRVLPVGNSHIAYGINLPSSILMSALMGTHRRDWGVQVSFCKTITTFMVENIIPYPLVPVEKATMDSFETLRGVVTASFASKYRPLQFRRNAYDSLFLESKDNGEKQSDGVMGETLIEDCAHMGPIMTIASELELRHYSALQITAWHFDIQWANNITPLRPYKNNTSNDTCDSSFMPKEARCAFVEVAPDTSLVLCVVDTDTAEVRKMNCATHSDYRSQQQERIWAHGWGPAIKFRRCGVLLKVPDTDTHLTLVPFDVDLTLDPKQHCDAFVEHGWNNLEFYKDSYYLASDGKGGTFKLPSVDVECMVAPYGTHIAISQDCPALAPYKAQQKKSQIPNNISQHERHEGWIAAWLVAQDYSVPSISTIPVVFKMQRRSKKTFALRVDVGTEHVRIFTDDHDRPLHKGCHLCLHELR